MRLSGWCLVCHRCIQRSFRSLVALPMLCLAQICFVVGCGPTDPLYDELDILDVGRQFPVSLLAKPISHACELVVVTNSQCSVSRSLATNWSEALLGASQAAGITTSGQWVMLDTTGTGVRPRWASSLPGALMPDRQSSLSRALGITVTPVTFLLGRNGDILLRWVGNVVVDKTTLQEYCL